MTDDMAGAGSTAGFSLPSITLVLGGARSGKSAYAERLIEAAGGGAYIATSEPPEMHGDAEMAARIAAHRDRRGPLWTTIEEPISLVSALGEAAKRGKPMLVDCLTIWTSNLLLNDFDIAAETDALCLKLVTLPVPVVLIASEVGLGIVPDNALARRFRDEAGRLNQRVAQVASRVTFIAAGLPLTLK
jgi:adenosylcobinamide kinase/adenosylcobinamide-phosphate guanylyltransferase